MLRSAAMISFALSLVLSLLPGDHCDPEARANSWSPDQKLETRSRVRHACELVGGSELYCDFWDAVVVRESWGGVASAVHVKGRDSDGVPEYGLGPMGLSVRWHARKLPGADPDPAFCSPEASFMVGHAIAVRAVEVYGADDAVEIQAIFGGGRGSYSCARVGAPVWWRHVPGLSWLLEIVGGRTECQATPQYRHVRSICDRMDTCRSKIKREDLGELISPEDRVSWAALAAEDWIKIRDSALVGR